MLVVLSGALPYAAHAQSSPSAALSLSSASVEGGTAITVTMKFSGLETDADTSTKDYIFRADVKDAENGDADRCENQANGYGLGVDRYMWKVDEDPEVRTGTVSADCPAGDYTVEASVSSSEGANLASASASFTITSPTTSQAQTDESCPGGGYAPTPATVEVESVPIVVESTTGQYFVLYVRHDLNGGAVEIPVSVVRGAAGTTTLAENVEALPKERYRVKKFLVADPADVDGDCIDDITELDNPERMNPVNSAAAIELGKGALAIPDQATFDVLEIGGLIKFIILGADTGRPRIYFQNTLNYVSHYAFLTAIGIKWDQPGLVSGYLGYYSHLSAPDGTPGIYAYEFTFGQPFGIADYSLTALAASVPLLKDKYVAYHLGKYRVPDYLHESASYEASRINVVFDQDVYPESRFIPLNEAEGYGFLRVMDLEKRPNPRDVVIYEALPNELPRVAGIITTVPQTPLAHVNLRAVQDGVPNAYISDARRNYINYFVGSYVHYEVTENDYSIRAATRAEVDAHFASSRPAAEQTPQRDLSVTEIKPLSQIGFDDWKAFGVKAANVAVLGTFDFPEGTVPDGFAIPFYFYDEFMKHNDFYTRIQTMLDDTDFQADLEVQESELKKLRKAIKKGETPGWIIEALTEMNESFPDGTNRRYRSSTNNEDLPGFNGAGLYDSKTQKPKEDKEDIAKSLKQVYASLWNFRAFTEREFHRIDHLAAAMGVLVHPNYSDELANGVAVSFNPLYGGREGWYYINTQVGEDLVTNPDALSVPEEILLDPNGGYYVVGTSNQKPPGQLLMSDAQLDQLRRHLTVIHERFAALYDPASSEEFAMEIEFKITSDNVLAIKQARPWVFSPASASDGVGTVALSSDATLSSLALRGIPITFAPATESYEARVGNDMGQTTVAATANDRGASYLVKLDGVADADGVIPLAVGANVITVEVTAEDGKTMQDYTITVTRAAPPSTDAALSRLELSGITFTFDPTTYSYDLSVGNGVTETTITAETKDGSASFQVALVTAEEYKDGTVTLAEGANLIYLAVTAEDGETTASYIITVTRAASSPDATLIALTLSGVNIGTFDSATTDYTASVGNDVTETRVAAKVNDGGASYLVKLDGVADADGVIPLAVGANVITVEVTAEDGKTMQDYTITVTRAAPPSTDAALSRLELSGITFTFDPTTYSYDLSVGNGVTETTITAETKDGSASFQVALVTAEEYKDGTVTLAEGANLIYLAVTAEDGETTASYIITVTRAASSPDATLIALTLSGVNIGTFDSATTDYTASVGNDVTETTVTATANDDRASYVVKLGGVAYADGTVALAVGVNAIRIVVTAEDGQTTKTYTVSVTRTEAEQAPDSPPDTPDAPTGEVTGKGQAKLDWNDAEGATIYQVRFWAVEVWVELPTADFGIILDGSGATVSNLPNYGLYYFSVRARNGAGWSDWSDYLTLANPDN